MRKMHVTYPQGEALLLLFCDPHVELFSLLLFDPRVKPLLLLFCDPHAELFSFLLFDPHFKTFCSYGKCNELPLLLFNSERIKAEI